MVGDGWLMGLDGRSGGGRRGGGGKGGRGVRGGRNVEVGLSHRLHSFNAFPKKKPPQYPSRFI